MSPQQLNDHFTKEGQYLANSCANYIDIGAFFPLLALVVLWLQKPEHCKYWHRSLILEYLNTFLEVSYYLNSIFLSNAKCYPCQRLISYMIHANWWKLVILAFSLKILQKPEPCTLSALALVHCCFMLSNMGTFDTNTREIYCFC